MERFKNASELIVKRNDNTFLIKNTDIYINLCNLKQNQFIFWIGSALFYEDYLVTKKCIVASPQRKFIDPSKQLIKLIILAYILYD